MKPEPLKDKMKLVFVEGEIEHGTEGYYESDVKAACEWYIEELALKLGLGDTSKEIDVKHWKLIVDKLKEAFEDVFKG